MTVRIGEGAYVAPRLRPGVVTMVALAAPARAIRSSTATSVSAVRLTTVEDDAL